MFARWRKSAPDSILETVMTKPARRKAPRVVGFAAPVIGIALSPAVADEWFRTTTLASIADTVASAGPLFEPPTLREMHAGGLVDASLSEDDYYDPWRATRFVACGCC